MANKPVALVLHGLLSLSSCRLGEPLDGFLGGDDSSIDAAYASGGSDSGSDGSDGGFGGSDGGFDGNVGAAAGSGGDDGGGTSGGGAAGSGGKETAGSGGLGGLAGTGGGSNMVYGMIYQADFHTDFILDFNRLLDDQYVQDHENGVQQGPAFLGVYTTAYAPIPPAGQFTRAFATHALSEGLDVIQQTITDTQKYASPAVAVLFSSPVVTSGPIVLGPTRQAPAQLFVMDVSDNFFVFCVAAIGLGLIEVTHAINTEAADGGELEFNGSNITLYHPSNTPFGDIRAEIKKQFSVCSFQ
ncbi:MAG TPA: hypothetical protein PKL73_16490 [Polyangiaceae bacterium]|nr:MAG: hypothetical protein BWY17_03352 [Deltaproteobacteria bacterium ADurb.Bin207]HNS98553.1 hypothetical protein [Polyangiaceae bacterium]HNZ24865.1 hypothetical protein [Polyangiaceae bacterium]HOD24603.1 hypothetical protein [Polyangiaceae bacterium]HOE50208.1 hypothetical protein [Polyangiaceae bacterium]